MIVMIEYILLTLFVVLFIITMVMEYLDEGQDNWANSKAYNDLNTTIIERNDTD